MSKTLQQSIFVNSGISEVSISYSHAVPAKERRTVRGSAESAEVLKPYFEDIELRERFYVLLMNQAQQVLGCWLASAGGIAGTCADIRLILVTALKSHATRLIVAHNHPSGNLQPSDADRRLTQQLKAAAAYMDIVLLDHLIITQDGYYSFADEGIL